MDDFDKTDKESLTDNLTYIYIVAIILWFVIIFLLGLFCDDILAILILMIPPIIFIFTIFNFSDCVKEVEAELLQTDILPFGVIIITILLSEDRNKYSTFMTKITTAGVVLLFLNMSDFWVSKYDHRIIKHIKSILRIMSLALFTYLFYAYYFIVKEEVPDVINPICNKPKQPKS